MHLDPFFGNINERESEREKARENKRGNRRKISVSAAIRDNRVSIVGLCFLDVLSCDELIAPIQSRLFLVWKRKRDCAIKKTNIKRILGRNIMNQYNMDRKRGIEEKIYYIERSAGY